MTGQSWAGNSGAAVHFSGVYYVQFCSKRCRWSLSIVATPIGNLADLSDRVRQVLAAADLVAAEDTRHSSRLLQHLGLSKPLLALHDHNERDRVGRILSALAEGQQVALISDAGTPLISDPGYILVREARKAGFPVSPIPGPCALVAALSAAGLPTDRFLFAGFCRLNGRVDVQRSWNCVNRLPLWCSTNPPSNSGPDAGSG